MNNKTAKAIAIALILCLTVALMAGCGDNKTQTADKPAEATAEKTEEPQNEAPAEAAEDSHVVVGDVVIPTQEEALAQLGLDSIPTKVLCTSYNTSMMAYTLGIEITATVDTKRPFPDELRALPNIGIVTGSTTFDFEQIISLAGDMVLGDSFFKEKLEPTLTEHGIKSYFVDAGTYKGMQEAVALIGPAFGKTEEAVKVIENWQAIEADVRAATENLEHPSALCFHTNLMRTRNSYVGSLLEILGVENATNSMGFGDDCPPYVPTEVEKILEADPDILLIPVRNPSEPNDDFLNEILTGDAWASLSAVKNDRVYPIDSNLFGMLATMECGDALIEMQHVIYGS